LLSAGSLGDRFGRKRTLTIGLVIFGVGSLLSGLSGSASLLIATRALMGVGGAFIMPATLSILTNVFVVPGERAKAIGVWAGVSAVGIALGPLLGGFLLQHFWWGSVFFVNLPIVIGSLIAGHFLVPDSRDPSAPRLDPVGAGLSIAGLSTVLWAVIEAPSHGWSSPSILVAFAIGALVLGAFAAWELTFSSPMLDLRFFQNPRFTAASSAVTLTFFALFGSLFLLTQYLQSVLGYSTLKAGAAILPQAVAMMIVAPNSPRIVRRIGSKLMVAFGLTMVGITLALFTTFDPHSSFTSVLLVGVLLGVGMGSIMAPATESIMGSLPRAKAGVGSAVNDTTRQVGGAVGVAVLGSIMASRYRAAMTSALHGVAAPAAVRDSVGRALAISQTLPPKTAALVSSAAKTSYSSGLHTAVMVGAVIAWLGAIEVLAFLPARSRGDEPVSEPEALAEPFPSELVPVPE
jgi:EmrB/QacA subfamily drug resistance transporter